MLENRLIAFVIRYRAALADLMMLTAVMAVAVFGAFEIDLFSNETGVSRAAETIELDEALLLATLLMLGLLAFAFRRHVAQRRELARRVAAERHARELAYQDPLTGLPNRRQFDEALAAACGSPPASGAEHAVFMLDLNGFKAINDVYGHDVGDEVLTVVARRLQTAVREGDLVARLGGDEFAMLATHVLGAEAAAGIGQRVIAALATPIAAGGTQHRMGAAIGVAMIPGNAKRPDEVLRKADVAMYRAKPERRSAMRFFETAMDRSVQQRAKLEQRLRAAVDGDCIDLLYTPVVDLRSGVAIGFEAMPRWQDRILGDVPAARFLPVAEDIGLIHELGANLLRNACATAVVWPAHITLSCDLYAGQLRDPRLAERVAAILTDTGMTPARLELDITEAAVVRDVEAARTTFAALREVGVRIALDNFGTGYSNLYHLRTIKLDKIKIDRRFVSQMTQEAESAEVVRALVGLGHGLGLEVAAQGVGSFDQQASLLISGCDQGAGGLFSQPLPATRTFEMLAA